MSKGPSPQTPAQKGGQSGLSAFRRYPAADEGAWHAFVAFLKQSGARVTSARRTVFDDVMSRHDHFRADDLAADLAKGPSRVSRGTVYRTLSLMVRGGFVRAIRDGDLHSHYEHVYGHGPHEHMVCEGCGAFVEFQAPEISRAIAARCREKAFTGRMHRLTVFGLCARCAGKRHS